jgi:hypothetical protein
VIKPEPHVWFEVSMGIGDERLPLALCLRVDSMVMLKITDVDDDSVIDTLLDVDQMSELIDALTLVRDAAKDMSDG